MKPTCSGCGQEIDPDTCWCGQPKGEHGYYDNHTFVPMGCDCFRAKGDFKPLEAVVND